MNFKKVICTFIFTVLVLFPSYINAAEVEVTTKEELVEAVTVSGNVIKLMNDIDLDQVITINNGQTLTLNLNGNDINITEAGKYIALHHGNLNIIGEGTIVEKQPYFSPIVIKGSTDSSASNYTTLTVGKDVTLTGWAGVMIDKYSSAAPKAYGVTVNIYGTLNGVDDIYDSTGASIYLNGSISDKTNYPIINLDGAKLLSTKGTGIYGAGYAKWNIKNTTIDAVGFGIGTKSGIYDIKGSTIIAKGEKADGVYNANGIGVTGAALQVESNSGYAGGLEINIEDSKLESKQGNAFYHYFAAKTEGEKVESSLLKFNTTSTEFIGGMEFVEKDDITIEGGKFTVDVSDYLKETYKLIKEGNMYVVNNYETEVVNKEKLSVKVDGKEVVNHIKPGSTVTLDVELDNNTYIKEIKVTKINDENTTVTVKNNSFVMPEYGVKIYIKTEECANKTGKVVELFNSPKVDSIVKLDENTTKEMTRKMENTSSNINSIDFEQLNVSDADLVEIEYNITLTKYDLENNVLAFVIKPYYKVSGEDANIIPNSAIKGVVKVNVPVPNSIKDTHVKVRHYNEEEKLIDEKIYEIKIDENGNKYITIETNSFSRFELSFYTPVQEKNPQTGDNIVYFIVASIISVLTISVVIPKNNSRKIKG